MQNIGQCIIISRKIYQEGKAATISTIYKMSLVLSITGLVLAQSPVEPIGSPYIPRMTIPDRFQVFEF